MFMGPLEAVKPWQTNQLMGVVRFRDRVFNIVKGPIDDGPISNNDLLKEMHDLAKIYELHVANSQSANNELGPVDLFLYRTNAMDVEIIKSQLDLNKWTNIASIICVTYTNHTKKSEEKRYFISTLAPQDVGRIAHAIRSHWQIENNLHWVLDVVFKEDDSRIRDERTAQNFAWFRKMALGLLAKDGTSISNKRKMLRNCINPEKIIEGLK